MNPSKTFKYLLFAVLPLALAPFVSTAADDGETSSDVPRREKVALITMTAKVTAIDHESREVTLEDEFGKQTTTTVSDLVERLDEIEAGDRVNVDLYLSLAFELREPTPEETGNPLQFLEGAGVAPEDVPPGVGALRVIKAVCTIEGIDRPTETVTLMGPLEGLNVVEVEDVTILPKLRIGEKVVVTYTEAMAIALEKVSE